ncbi:MAG: hypothetical protein M3506_01110 [Chloroflexota bacterium]|nr:hypothetical protein [Chloroflexota bacterium]
MKKEFIIERQGKHFVLYAGLLEEAHSQGLKEITTTLVQLPNQDNGNIAVCQAVVETERGRFTGIGDASHENVAPIMRQHIIRMAETRAKARALRDAVNVGVTALEELGGDDDVVSAQAGNGVSPHLSRSVSAVPTHGEERDGEPRGLGPRTATEKQLKAIFAIAQSGLNLSRSDVEAKCRDIYGYPPQELSRWEASQFIDLLKQDKVA